MTTARIELPPKLIPVFTGKADVRGAHGGRGSGKTRSFALMSAIRAYMWDRAGRTGMILCCRQFMNSLDESSLEEVKAAIRGCDWLLPHFDIGEKYVRTKSGRIAYKFAGLDRNINSVKSKSRILVCWVEEAEPVTETAWATLIPTLREEDSELWVTWNPERKDSATNQRFFKSENPLHKIAEVNWQDNPWFPDILNRVREADKSERPDQYGHVWEGEFKTAIAGAYFASHIHQAREERRIGRVAKDPLMTIRAYWDIGGTGAKADATAIWIVQFVGREVRVLDHYEAQGQPLATHVNWLRENGYGKALCVLPHDGSTKDKVHDVSFESALEEAGFETEVVPNQGAGAARMRIEAVRRLFPSMWFNEETTEAGVEALGWYHEKKDEQRGIGLGPNHDWASHSADAFGLMAVHYEQPRIQGKQSRYGGRSSSSTSWMAG
ncbi:PBSX family phage terminase large subunit [Ochrobactrum sp. EDr1-4]|uniref:PBSX family phage terminase large subunit n=1 Tax=Ochrobactrum sp. EDr1-4 TaxID=3368622 RepID=UPI003BA0EF7D